MRHSEDIDLDVAVVARGKLAKKIDRLLKSPTVPAPLPMHGTELEIDKKFRWL